MTEEQIKKRCEQIEGALSPTAWEAYHLASECTSARYWWRDDCDNVENRIKYGNAATQLEDFCMSNKSVRAEAEAAIKKIDKLIRDDANDPTTKVEYNKEVARINQEIEIFKNAKNKKNGKDRKFFKILKIIMTVSITLWAAIFVANFFLFDMTLSMFGFDCLAAFIVSLIITIVKSNSNKKRIAELEKKLTYMAENEERHDKDRLSSATRDKYCYDLIIRGTCGNSLADFL